MNTTQRNILIVLAVLLSAFFIFDLGSYLTLDAFNASKAELLNYADANPWKAALIYFAIYIVVTGLSIPGATIMTLAGGAVFGFWKGLLLVSFASSIGATLAFLVARSVLHDWVQERFGARLAPLNEGVRKDGGFYLFGIRLVPVFPFVLVNLLMALTPIRVTTFYGVSQLGMLPATAVYVNAGTQLAEVDSIGLPSIAFLMSFVLLVFFPLLARFFMQRLQDWQHLRKYKKPAKFDANLLVIGGGSAGLVASLIGATVNAKAVLVEREKMGGDCLNTGCVPSKALLRAAKLRHQSGQLAGFGLDLPAPAAVDFAAVMQRVQQVIKRIEPHDSVERFESLGVQCEQGDARIVSPWEVEISRPDGSSKRLSAKNIVLASGARPLVPPIPGLDAVDYLTSDSIWALQELPEQLLVMGAGPIGCELAQAFARLGSQVTLVDMAERVLPREDADAAEILTAQLLADGIELCLGARAVAAEPDCLIVEKEGAEQRLPFKQILVAVGRKPNTEGMGLEELDIDLNKNGTVQVNEYLQTSIPSIFACGDVAGPYQFTHTASHQAWYAAVNALFGTFKRFKVDYSVIPWATFTDLEVARVGLSEDEANAQGIAYEVTRYGIDDLDRAIADGVDKGFVKVLTRPGGDKILGVTIVGYHASDLLAEYVLAMKHGLGLRKILGTIHLYPSLAEANKFAAGEWQKAHKPQGLLDWVKKYHDWRRG
jgi:pyruvate/2-oxoglutarate dehydrogenase complex dihydrolipoamide dehydrogenase (E3) component/uncharacterized membrane protein YdjX (TVP38/TMEM64 family)